MEREGGVINKAVSKKDVEVVSDVEVAVSKAEGRNMGEHREGQGMHRGYRKDKYLARGIIRKTKQPGAGVIRKAKKPWAGIIRKTKQPSTGIIRNVKP